MAHRTEWPAGQAYHSLWHVGMAATVAGGTSDLRMVLCIKACLSPVHLCHPALENHVGGHGADQQDSAEGRYTSQFLPHSCVPLLTLLRCRLVGVVIGVIE